MKIIACDDIYDFKAEIEMKYELIQKAMQLLGDGNIEKAISFYTNLIDDDLFKNDY